LERGEIVRVKNRQGFSVWDPPMGDSQALFLDAPL
jgi:hypothetical protein